MLYLNLFPGPTELSTVETRLTPTPIFRDSCTDLRVLVLQPPQEPLHLQETVDSRPPLPPKTSKLSSVVATETQPLLTSNRLASISQGCLVRVQKDEEDLRV